MQRRPSYRDDSGAARVIFAFTAVIIIVLLMIPLLHFYRLHHFPHTVATVESVWTVRDSGRGARLFEVGQLSFSRTTPDGKTVSCDHPFVIGAPEDGFKAGDKIEIVPARGTCERVDVIGRAP